MKRGRQTAGDGRAVTLCLARCAMRVAHRSEIPLHLRTSRAEIAFFAATAASPTVIDAPPYSALITAWLRVACAA